MKKPKIQNLKIDKEGTKRLREKVSKAKIVKITLNIDKESYTLLKKISAESGVPYQRLLNNLLKQSLEQRSSSESKIEKLERELKEIKKKLAA